MYSFGSKIQEKDTNIMNSYRTLSTPTKIKGRWRKKLKLCKQT